MLTLQYHGGLKTKIDNKNGIYFFLTLQVIRI